MTTLQKNLVKFCDTSHWRSVVGLTLNLKQSIVTPSGGFISIDELGAKRSFRHFMNRLNRRIYKSAFRQHGKRLQVIPLLERSAEGRWHYHVAIEPPSFLDDTEFGQIAMEAWLQTPMGYGHCGISTDVNEGWISYMTKLRGKSGLEAYIDCIDTDAFYNTPIASA